VIASHARRLLFAAFAGVVAVTAASCAKGHRPPAQPAESAPPPPASAPPPPPLEATALTGDWARAAAAQGVQGLRLGDGGALTIVGTAPTRGLGWKAEGRSLQLSMENPGVGPWELSVPVEDASPSRLRLGGGNPAFAGEWRRATFTTLQGTVSYRQREALTPEAVVFVDLRDAGAPPEAPPDARVRVVAPGQVPIPFRLTYDPASLDASRSYALSARITDRGELRFVTEKPVPLPTAGDAPPVEIVVGPVR
jgi:putative lipoprotein